MVDNNLDTDSAIFAGRSTFLKAQKSFFNRDYAEADIIRLSTFFRNNPVPILVFSPNGEVIKTNPVADRLLRRLQVEETALLPANHAQIVQDCLATQTECTAEISVNNLTFVLTYHALPDFKLVYVYVIDMTDYRQVKADLLQIATQTIALAKLAVLQLQTFQRSLPTGWRRNCYSFGNSFGSSVTQDWFVAMDGCVFSGSEAD